MIELLKIFRKNSLPKKLKFDDMKGFLKPMVQIYIVIKIFLFVVFKSRH